MHKLTALLIALTAPCAFAQVTCQTIGSFTTCSDGRSYNNIGNFTYGSDGSSAQRIGNSTFITPPPQPAYVPQPVYPTYPAPQAQQPPPGMLRPQQCGYNSLGRWVCF